MKKLTVFALVFSVTAIWMVFGCGGGSGGGDGGTGTLSLSLTDSAIQGLKAVYVTIDDVEVHLGGNENVKGNWATVASPQRTFNLCELVNGVREELGLASLGSGRYTQMRLIIGATPDDGINILSQAHPYANYVIDENDVSHELKVPSGFQTGYKIVQGFTINSTQTTELVLDFDALRSVVKAGSSGLWLLKPTVKVKELKDYAIAAGFVEASDLTAIENAMVSLQQYDAGAQDAADQVIIETSSLTDVNGGYEIIVAPDTYNMVVYAEGYAPVCMKITLRPGDNIIDQDFSLSTATTFNATGSVQITGGTEEQYATLSFRQLATCEQGSPQELIEVSAVNIATGGRYDVNLPEGDYTLVVSSYGMTTESYPVSLFSNVLTNVTLNPIP